MPDGEYSDRMAKALWATRKIHEAEGLAILPHPFWVQAFNNSAYNLALPFLEMLFKDGGFDAYEIIGEMRTNGYNLSVSSYVETEREVEGVDIIALNTEIKKTVAREQVLRGEIDKIIAELEVEQ